MAKVYSFGDRFIAPAFRRAMNEVAVDYVRSLMLSPSNILELTRWAFEHIPSNRPLLQLLVNQLCQDWYDDEPDMKGSIKALRELPATFVGRVIQRYCHLRNNSRTSEGTVYCYSEHATDEEKVACGGAHMRYDEDEEFGYFD